jgi:hypothetical protein
MARRLGFLLHKQYFDITEQRLLEKEKQTAGLTNRARFQPVYAVYSKIMLVNVTAEPVSGAKAWP